MNKRVILFSFLVMFSLVSGLPAAQDSSSEDAKSLFYAPVYSGSDLDGPAEEYIIQRGDTLRSIARRKLGDPDQAEMIARINGINDIHRIYAGQKIKIPTPSIELSYSIELLVNKDNDDCDLVRVNSGHLFSTSDRFKLRVAANHDGHLYIFNKDTQATIRRLFPDLRIDTGRNFIRKFTAYQVPSSGWLEFTMPAGEEQVLIIFSMASIEELDVLVLTDEKTLSAGQWARIVDLFTRLEGVDADDESREGESFLIRTKTRGTNALAVRFTLRHEG